jgi:transposase
MSQKRKYIDSIIKARVALDAVRNEKTTAQLVSQYEVQSGQISTWKKKLIEGSVDIFEDRRSKEMRDKNFEKIEEDYQRQIGKMQMEIEWLKKKSKQLGL